jgi:predicted Zn-dependent protease
MVIALVTVFASSVTGQTSKPGQDPRARERDKARAERDARRYDQLKTFALTLYQTDPDFRDEVDEHFDDVQRQHSEQAFNKNIATPARPTVVHDGDRLRLQNGLYDNKLVSDYINRVGQALVPRDSDKLFAFRLVAHPIPFAETLSTGTIYISTGLVSLLDNEAQLAYVLAHEMAHGQLDHWRLKSALVLAQDEFDKKEGAKRRWLGLGIGAAVGATVAGVSGASAGSTIQASAGGALLGAAIGHAWGSAMTLDWDTVQENEADSAAFQTILNRNYDVRQVRTLYATLQQAVRQDQRVGLAFIGNRRRTAERMANTDELIARMKGDLDAREGKLTLTQPEYVRVMATLRRDNGILSFYHDMFQLAKANLEYAREHRPNDPAAHYYYGKVLKLIGRTEEDRKLADEAFQRALQFDHRERNYGAHFYRALALIDRKDASLNSEIAKELQAYLMASIRFASEEASFANALPANIDDMYDYLTEVGDVKWRPIVPDPLKPVLTQVGTDAQRPESPLKGAKPAPPPQKKP